MLVQSEGHLMGWMGGSGWGGDDYALRIWYLASLNKKMLSEMVACCYIQKLKHTISQEKKCQLHLKTENRNRTNQHGEGLCKLCAAQMKFKYYFQAV